MPSTFIARGAQAYEAAMGRWSRKLSDPFLAFAGVPPHRPRPRRRLRHRQPDAWHSQPTPACRPSKPSTSKKISSTALRARTE